MIQRVLASKSLVAYVLACLTGLTLYFRWLALSDEFSAKVASELWGKEDQWKVNYNISESGHDARVSLWTGKAIAHKADVIFGSLCGVPTWGMSFSGRIFPAMPFSPRCFSALAVSRF